jgi:hypothetical protein
MINPALLQNGDIVPHRFQAAGGNGVISKPAAVEPPFPNVNIKLL